MTTTARRAGLLTAGLASAALLAACGSHRALPRPRRAAPAPSCRRSWLAVSVPHPDPEGLLRQPTSREVVLVTASRRCSLKGWPELAQVPAGPRESGTRPRFHETRLGRPAVVTISPAQAAEAGLVIRLPEAWTWPGSNVCAGMVSAMVSLPGLEPSYFVLSATRNAPLCGMPPTVVLPVSARPFRPVPARAG